MNRRRDRAVSRPGLEPLEGRRVPAQVGVPWHDSDHLAVSFLPDGTSVAGTTSDLFAALDSSQPSAAWQGEILRAFQAWAVAADVNFALVPDGGQPVGTPGPDQHDPRFGDIRIGAVPMAPGVLAISVPHDPFLSGTWSGDILLNSNAHFEGATDLFPVLLHEVGHVLGFDDNADPSSAMNARLDPARKGLGPADVAAVRALYGPRPDDPYDEVWTNDTPATATPFPAPGGFDGSTPLFLYANVSAPGDSDVYSLTAPDGYRGPLTVRLQTAGVSLLAPRLAVLDSTGRAVADAASLAPFGDTLVVRLSRVEPGATYYIQAGAANPGDPLAVGEYALAASFDGRSSVSAGAIVTLSRQSYSYLSADDLRAIFLDPTSALFQDDRHTNDSPATATPLSPDGNYDANAPARVTASLADPLDQDFYRIETPNAIGDGSPFVVLTITVRATEVNGIMPSVAVLTAAGKPLPALVLARGDGTETIQLASARPGTPYLIRVVGDPESGKVVGNYDLDVEYGRTPAAPTTFVASDLSQTAPQRFYRIQVNQTQLFDFLLAAAAPGGPSPVVRLTIADSQGRIVLKRSVNAGEVSGGDPVLLPPGLYTVAFQADTPPDSPLAFRLYGGSLSDPIGPALEATTLRPFAGFSTIDPAAPPPPALGTMDSPYTWLALTLTAPRGPNRPDSATGRADALGSVLPASFGLLPPPAFQTGTRTTPGTAPNLSIAATGRPYQGLAARGVAARSEAGRRVAAFGFGEALTGTAVIALNGEKTGGRGSSSRQPEGPAPPPRTPAGRPPVQVPRPLAWGQSWAHSLTTAAAPSLAAREARIGFDPTPAVLIIGAYHLFGRLRTLPDPLRRSSTSETARVSSALPVFDALEAWQSHVSRRRRRFRRLRRLSVRRTSGVSAAVSGRSTH